jgi:two-component system, NarL family, response regulator NreC
LISVLLVDDHALFSAGLRSRLEQERDVGPINDARTPEQALLKARMLQPNVVLLDLLLPRRSGADLVPEISRIAPRSRIIVVSSQANPTAVRQAIAAGAAGYVPKHASERELVEAIRRVAAGGRYVDPDLGAQLVVPDALPELEPLTDRERDVFTLLALGYTNQEIGKRLFISVRTVNSHRAHVMQKLRLETRAELVLLALSSGVVGGQGECRVWQPAGSARRQRSGMPQKADEFLANFK